MSRGRSGYLPVLVLSIALLLASGGWFAWSMSTQRSALEPPVTPVTAEVRAAKLDYSAKATLTWRPTAGSPVLWNGASGTITALRSRAGDTLTTGSPVVDVDGITRRSYHAETALYRPLGEGAKGPDVKVAQALLNEMLPDVHLPVSGSFGAATKAAVRAYEKQLGLGTTTGVLDPGWFLLLPTPRFRVASMGIQVGQPAPTAGTPVLESADEVRDVRLESESGGPAGSYTFMYKGAGYAAEKTADGWSLADPSAVVELLTTPSADVGTDTQIEGRIALTRPASGQAVPPSALVPGAEGALFVTSGTHKLRRGGPCFGGVTIMRRAFAWR